MFDARRSTLFAHFLNPSTSQPLNRLMRRYSQRQNLSSLSEINITPLLDLAFVLLIIFMITTPLLENSMSLVIPSSAEKNPADSAQVQTISIDRNEQIQLNGKSIDVQSLGAELSNLKANNPDVAVVIRPDRELPVQKLVTLMDALQQAQIMKVGIATKAEGK